MPEQDCRIIRNKPVNVLKIVFLVYKENFDQFSYCSTQENFEMFSKSQNRKLRLGGLYTFQMNKFGF